MVIESYLADLGLLRSSLSHCTLTTACQIALEGPGPVDLKDQLIATIVWQEAQMQRAGQLLEHLAKAGFITDVVDSEIAH